MDLQWPDKDPDTTLDYDLDMSEVIPAVDTITAVTATIDSPVTIPALTVVATAFDIPTRVVKVWLTSGLSNTMYRVKVRVQTNWTPSRDIEVMVAIRVSENSGLTPVIPIVVETGLNVPGANALASVADVDAYHALRFNGAWTASADQKVAAIVAATDYVNTAYLYQGSPTYDDQVLVFPRAGMIDADGREYASDEIPVLVKQAIAELALVYVLNGEIVPIKVEGGARMRRERVGAIELEVDYADTENAVAFPKVYALLVPFIATGLVSGGSYSLLRG